MMVRKILADWVSEYIICGDSVISLCWVSAERKSLSMFHRNRVVQIRRSSDLDCLFHVVTEENLADLGTRPERVKLTDIGPDSQWELGKPWMREDISSAIENGLLKPIKDFVSLQRRRQRTIRMDFYSGRRIMKQFAM